MASYPLGSYWTVAAFLFFVFAPILPNALIQFAAGTYIGNFILILAVLVASRISLGATLSTFMAVAVMYVEYRQRVLARIITTFPVNEKTGEKEDIPVNKAVEVENRREEVMFDSEDNKYPLQTVAGGVKDVRFFQQNRLA